MKAVPAEVVGRYILIHSQREGEQDVLGLLWVSQTSNHIPNDVFFLQKGQTYSNKASSPNPSIASQRMPLTDD